MTNIAQDGFLIGQAISSHHGVLCYPAICEESGEQFFIKSIRVPASSVQASGLLLSGAYQSAQEVSDYFRTMADDLCDEAKMMSSIDGFIPFDRCEVSDAENGIGFQVELLTKRRECISTLEWTPKLALDMTMDLCNALSACRSKGMLYVNLKPENVFFDGERFCIGDLGLISMDALSYASLPEKYRSDYTAPEIKDEYASISENADVYALGLMLYRVFNGNTLPQDATVPPRFADYELWKMISKAICADPAERYEKPDDLAMDLQNYLECTTPDDTAIGMTPAEEPKPQQDDFLFLSEAENEAMLSALLAKIPDEEPPADIMDALMEQTEDADDPQAMEMDDMMGLADELISHQLPQPVVAPAVIDVSLPLPELEAQIPEEPEQIEEPAAMAELIIRDDAPISAEATPEQEPMETAPEQEDEEIWDAPKKTNVKKVLITVCSICAALVILIMGAIHYYDHIYTLRIEKLTLNVTDDTVTVHIDSHIDDELLTVICSQASGSTQKVSVKNGQATISGLEPGFRYIISVEARGFHRLVGHVDEPFATKANVQVSSFTADYDRNPGWVKLHVTASGNDNWTVRYSTDGETEKIVAFVGTEVSIGGLTPGKEYTFILESQDGAAIHGNNQVTYTAR